MACFHLFSGMPDSPRAAYLVILYVAALLGIIFRADALSDRRLSVSQFISSSPSPIDIEMYYSRADPNKSVECFNFTINNSGSGSEIIDFGDIPRYLQHHQISSPPPIHSSIDREVRVGQASAYGQGPANAGVGAVDRCRIIYDSATAPYFDVNSNLSIPVNLTYTVYHLAMLQIGVIEIVGTNDPTPFVQQMNMMGMLAEEDFSIELANHDRRSLSMSAPDDTYFGQQWALDDMRVHQILNDRLSDNNTSCDQDDHPMIPVALIDSGVDYGHPDVADAIYENEAEDGMMAQYLVDDDSNGFIDDVRGWNFIDENANVMDNNGHGTACAGLIAAEGFNGEGIIGVGYPFARVLPLKVFDYDVTGRLSDVLRAFDYAIDKGVKISSVSWFARSYSAVFHIAVGRAGTFGHLLVAAAGNDGQDLDVMGGSYPCGFNATNVLCTAAHTASGDRWISSNYGPIVVDVSAPGVNVISTATPNGYATFNGTSLAAAEVAGLAALLIGARSPFPLAFDEVIAAIISTASVSGWTAYGRVDAYAALQAVVGNANWLNGALTVWKDDECVEYVRLSPFSSVEMQLCVFTPPMIGYREYDLGGVIGEGAVHLDIRLRAVPPPGACQVSVPMIDFGVLMAGSTGIASYTITNTFGSDLVVDPSRILPTTPEVQVILPAGPVVVAEGQSVIVELSLAVFHPGPVNLVVDSLSENCPPIPLTASVQSSTIRVSNGSATNSTEYIPVGLRMVPSTATIENPSTYELKTQVVASDAEYLVEGPFSAVSFPIWPTGGGWVPEISIVGQHILSGCIGGEVHMISLGQYFPFFGVDVDSVNVGCNGFIELPPLSPSPVTALPRIPSPAEPKHAIAAYWTEANSTRCSVSSCNISYVLDYKTRLLVVEWDGLEVRVNNSWHTLSMQVHLFSEGRIDLLYASLPDPAYREDVAAGLKGSDANDCPNLMHLLATSGPLTLIFIPKVKSQQVIVPPLSSMSVNFSLAVPYMGVPDDDLDAWCEDDINWLDGAGRHCADYVAEALCTPAGLYGIGWNALWGDFMTVATTTPANVSCCGCGGGTWYRDDSPGADWQDIVKLELKYSNSSQGKFDRTVKGSQSLDLILTGIEPVVSTAGGNRILRVVALDSSGVINNKETGLIVTVEVFENGLPLASKRAVLNDGEAMVDFDFPAGVTELTAVASPSEPIFLDVSLVDCGGDSTVGPNGLRYLLWKLAGDSYVLKCATLSADETSWIDPLGGVLNPQDNEGWMSIMMANENGVVVTATDSTPRRVSNVLLGFEGGGIGIGGCGGFCVFGGMLSVNFGMSLRPSLIKILREESTITTTDDDGRGGGSSTTVSTRTGDVITVTSTTTTSTVFAVDCDAGCRAIRPGSYCKYWLNPSVCYASDVPCICTTIP